MTKKYNFDFYFNFNYCEERKKKKEKDDLQQMYGWSRGPRIPRLHIGHRFLAAMASMARVAAASRRRR